MATDRDEQRRQAQELEEIRRSFAEMGARMGSLFEPAEVDEPERAPQPTPPASEAATPSRSRWRVGALALLFLAGTAIGWALPKGDADPEPQATTATSQAQVTEPPSSPAPEIRTRVSVPETCVDTAELADEVISRLNRNARDNRLALALRDYTIASQACRREASP
jgi:hypothetical protein